MKINNKRIYLLFAVQLLVLSFFGCKKDNHNSGPVPLLTTINSSHVTGTSVRCGGNVTNDNGCTVIERGVCWSKNPDPTIDNDKTSDGTGAGEFVSTINYLNPNTPYYFRAYAKNCNGVGYGSTITITTSNLQPLDLYQGGIVIEDYGSYVLIAALEDYPQNVQWGCSGIFITGAMDEYDGYQNTINIVSQCNEVSTAAKVCSDFVVNGYDDWYLPSYYEMMKVLNYLGDNIGLSWYDKYWTSTQMNSVEAEYVWTGQTNPYNHEKENQMKFRPVRRYYYSEKPDAAFTGNPTSGNNPLPVNFTDQSINIPTSWLWDFGDGNTSTLKNPSHTYNNAGTYAVKLKVSNTEGSNELIQIDYINVQIAGSGTVMDIDGNVYKTIEIGTQNWMAENLKVNHYRDGTIIDFPDADYTAWENNSSGAYAWFNDDISWKDSYGALYNWYAVDNINGLCPSGWHVPSDGEWTTLTTFAGGDVIAGGKLKSTRTEPDPHPRWISPNTGATDEYYFAALPGGSKFNEGGYMATEYTGSWWSSSSYSSTSAWYRRIYFDSDTIYRRYSSYLTSGLSVRCVKD